MYYLPFVAFFLSFYLFYYLLVFLSFLLFFLSSGSLLYCLKSFYLFVCVASVVIITRCK